MTSRMSATVEIEQLRKKLMHAQSRISELEDELREKESNRYAIATVSLDLSKNS